MPSSWAADGDDFAHLSDGGRIRHQPGLDGLRGLAVAAVVVFHTGLGWLPGGYLGVSLFFTISGVVIGTVILSEIERHGSFSPRAFWTRRGRRLLPAAWVLLTVVAIVRVTSTVFSATTGSDIVAAWLQVANWHFLLQHDSYGDLFGGPSAVLHFWSLAIEEQFYVAVGLGAVLLARSSRRPARHLGIVAGALALVSFALPVVLSLGVDRTYYGTETRAGELLVGLVLAAVIADRGRRQLVLGWRRPLAVAGIVALVVVIGLWRVLDAGTAALRTGVLPLSASLSCVLIVGALVPGPVRLLATTRPLRRLGDISYALYLVHWPVFVAVRRVEPDAGVGVFAVATAVSVGLAVLSTRLLEVPVRARRIPPSWLGAGAVGLVACLVATLVVPAQRTDAEQVLGRIEQLAGDAPTATTTAAATTAGAAPAASTPRPAGEPPPAGTTEAPAVRPRLAFFGDSVALSLGLAMAHAPADRRFDVGPGTVELGCGAALWPGDDPATVTRCEQMVPAMAAVVGREALSGVIVVSCQWELVAQSVPGSDDIIRVPGDAVFDEYVRTAYRRVAESLRAAGAGQVLWVRCPELSREHMPPGISDELLASREPARVAATNRVVDELAADGVLTVVDLAAWVDPRRDDPTLRPDGSHYDFDVDTGVAAELTRELDAALT